MDANELVFEGLYPSEDFLRSTGTGDAGSISFDIIVSCTVFNTIS